MAMSVLKDLDGLAARAAEAAKASEQRIRDMDRAYLKEVDSELLVEELTSRGYEVLATAVASEAKPELACELTVMDRARLPIHRGFRSNEDYECGSYVFTPWTPENDHRPKTWNRIGYSRDDTDPWGTLLRGLGTAKKGECTRCVKEDGPIQQAMFRILTHQNARTAVASWCWEHADAFVKQFNNVDTLPKLDRIEPLEVPSFADAETALAWLDEISSKT